MELEHKAFSLKLDAPPDSDGRFSGYAAVFGNVDLGNDVIEPGAFTKTLQETPSVAILWAHDTDEPIGVSTLMVEDDRGLKVDGQLAMDVQRAREVHSLMKLGAVKGLSIGYNVVKRQFKGQIRHLQELKLGEFSLCVFPMNPEANVSDVKRREQKDWLDDWNPTADRILWMISAGSDFMSTLVGYAEYDLAEQVQEMIEALADKLFAAVQSDDEGMDDDTKARLSDQIKQTINAAAEKVADKLQALPNSEPAETTPSEGAAKSASVDDSTEPEVASTLRETIAAFKR